MGKEVDRNEWQMTPPTVNAYYDPQRNHMVFPAGILQPPFYSVKSATPVNLGAIGMVVGHELTHGFDDEGSQFDAQGDLENWWSPEVASRFKEKTACVRDQYAAYEPLPGRKINGELTLGENIADLAGLKLAFEAYRDLARMPTSAGSRCAGQPPSVASARTNDGAWLSQRRSSAPRTSRPPPTGCSPPRGRTAQRETTTRRSASGCLSKSGVRRAIMLRVSMLPLFAAGGLGIVLIACSSAPPQNPEGSTENSAGSGGCGPAAVDGTCAGPTGASGGGAGGGSDPEDGLGVESWSIATIEESSHDGMENAIRATNDQTAYLVYKRIKGKADAYDVAPAELVVAKTTDAFKTWVATTIDPDAPETQYVVDRSVSIDAVGNHVCVTYFAPTSNLFADYELRFARSTDGGATWVRSTVATHGGAYNATRIVDAKTVFISYRVDSPVPAAAVVMTQDGGETWTPLGTTNAGGSSTGIDTSLVVTGSGAELVYRDIEYAQAGLHFARQTTNSFAVATIDKEPGFTMGIGASLAAAGSMRFVSHGALDAQDRGQLRFLRSTDAGDTWSTTTLASALSDAIISTDLRALDEKRLYLAYRWPDDLTASLRFSWSADGGASWTMTKPPDLLHDAWRFGLAVPSAATQYVSYEAKSFLATDLQSPRLKVARRRLTLGTP